MAFAFRIGRKCRADLRFVRDLLHAAKAGPGAKLGALDKLRAKPKTEGAWSTRMGVELKTKREAANELHYFSFFCGLGA